MVRFPQFFEKQLLSSTTTLLTVLHSHAWCARNNGTPYKQLPRQSEFLLTPKLRWSHFEKGGWGLTYTNKTREAHVLLAVCPMKDMSRNRGIRMCYKTYYTIHTWKSFKNWGISLYLELLHHFQDFVHSSFASICTFDWNKYLTYVFKQATADLMMLVLLSKQHPKQF